MSEWLTRVINESEAKGMAQGMEKGLIEGRMEGRAEGEIKALNGLVKDGILTIGDAAKRTNLSISDFQSVLHLLNEADRDWLLKTESSNPMTKKEPRAMSEWLKEMTNESESRGAALGMAKGRIEGRIKGQAEGEIKTLADLVRDGILTIGDAAKRANLSVAEFAEKAGM